MMPQLYLHDHGLPISAYEVRYVGSQESSIMNVYLGNTAAGATWPPPWIAFQKDHGDIADQLKVQWTTEALLNNSLVARDDFPPELLKRVADILFSLQAGKEGREILARLPLSKFEAANDETYRPVYEFVEKFGKTVRPLNE
jgi:phosphonate transport system substrate-binding protein